MTASTHPSSPIPHPVIIDTDPGIDDCLALLLALKSPELDVRGISISYGNTVIEHAWRNAVEILRRQGLLEGIWCLDPNETLSPGQSEEISRVYAAYHHLNDDAFVHQHLASWLTP